MALFDSLLSEVNTRFHLGDKGGALVSALFNLVTNNGSGLSGFLEMFRRIGLGQVADSWVSQGANSALSNQQTEDALGTNNLNDIAAKAGLPLAAATSALSFLIPAVVDKLTPNGVIPSNSNLMDMSSEYLTVGADEALASGRVETARATTVGAGMPDRPDAAGEMFNNNPRSAAAVTDTDDNSPLRWILPLVLLALLCLVGYQFCSKPNQNVAMANINANASTTVNGNTAVTTENANVSK